MNLPHYQNIVILVWWRHFYNANTIWWANQFHWKFAIITASAIVVDLAKFEVMKAASFTTTAIFQPVTTPPSIDIIREIILNKSFIMKLWYDYSEFIKILWARHISHMARLRPEDAYKYEIQAIGK